MENKIKVAVITRHSIFNYGSLLQTIATQESINRLGYECVIIDYQRADEDYHKIASVLVKSTKWNKNIITRLIYKMIQSPKFYVMGHHFEKMRKNTIQMTRKYTSLDDLRSDKPIADIYLTGSDQVWGPIGADAFDPAYFLSFADDSDVRVAYAGSFGRTKFSDNIIAQFKSYLEKYQSITVREKSAVKIIEDMGISSVNQVLDPSLLLDADYWSRMIHDKFPENYILIYQLHNNPQMLEYAYKLAERTGLKLVAMSSTVRHLVHKGSKHVFLPTLSQWLGYIKNARFMITDSFHGTAFAINMNTQFVNILPEGTATRNQSILELTGLENRVVKNFSDFSLFEQQIDFELVNEIISEKRKESISILKEILTVEREKS
jgi:hypothetical protein